MRHETYLALLAPTLPKIIPAQELEAARALLRLAKADGLDPAALYADAVRSRPDWWPPAPPWAEVAV